MDAKQTLKALMKLDKTLVKESKKFQKMLGKASKLMQAAIVDATLGKIHKSLDNGQLAQAVADLMFETEGEVYDLEDAVGEDVAADAEEDEETEDDGEE